MNIRKSKKAFSPVVASIILIAVTVAVGLAVAAWMGALTFSYMGSSSLTITNTVFSGGTGVPTNNIILSIKNTGTKVVTIDQIKVNDVIADISNSTNVLTYSAGTRGTITLDNVKWVNGNPYAINLYDANWNGVGSTQMNAPGG